MCALIITEILTERVNPHPPAPKARRDAATTPAVRRAARSVERESRCSPHSPSSSLLRPHAGAVHAVPVTGPVEMRERHVHWDVTHVQRFVDDDVVVRRL